MYPPSSFSRVVNRFSYDVDKATLLAADNFTNGYNTDNQGRNTFLYKTAKGRFFVVNLTCWEHEENTLEPINEDLAIHLFENQLSYHYEPYETAFPNVIVEEA